MISIDETKLGSTIARGTMRDPGLPELPSYQILERIGHGGMGIVHRARHLTTGKLCAVKFIRPELVASYHGGPLLDEISILSQLQHPNIVAMWEHGQAWDGTRYLAMEYLSGLDFDAFVQRHGPISSCDARQVMRQLCTALRQVHQRGLVHRDIKPANLLYDHGHVTLIDFGLARTCWQGSRQQVTHQDDAFAGSPMFAAPEASRGKWDPRSDIYSLGATAFFLLAGQPVFPETNTLDAILAHSQHTPPGIRAIRPSVWLALEEIIEICLAKDPADRFSSVDQLDAALAKAGPCCGCLGTSISAVA